MALHLVVVLVVTHGIWWWHSPLDCWTDSVWDHHIWRWLSTLLIAAQPFCPNIHLITKKTVVLSMVVLILVTSPPTQTRESEDENAGSYLKKHQKEECWLWRHSSRLIVQTHLQYPSAMYRKEVKLLETYLLQITFSIEKQPFMFFRNKSKNTWLLNWINKIFGTGFQWFCIECFGSKLKALHGFELKILLSPY